MVFLTGALPYIINIITSIVVAILTFQFKKIAQEHERKNDELDKRQKAISDGLESLLREKIIDNFNRYSERGYCPIYAKESIKQVYKAYHALGGNDVATELYNKILKMKESEDKDND